ncbi:TlpA family protein disulfide reductase [Chitinophaga silvatica]|uniref:TlpA family protein disulfide reductase n=1 Tax=Chitinophaga silvatica TaxID=2282649 RepID=A0A3E1Y3L5_9BACT|nr:TlpA disulfide reductase family protein [Chitinophaga silvatica]RFS19288.1 TlpA family protein disulfide reductase [Chitinophaga silvatica]
MINKSISQSFSLIISSILIGIISCSAPHANSYKIQNDSIVISGNLTEFLHFSYVNQNNDLIGVFITPDSTKTRFREVIYTNLPVRIAFDKNRNFSPAILYPGDEVEVSPHPQYADAYYFNGKHPNDLNFLTTLEHEKGYVFSSYNINNGINFNFFMNFIRDKYIERKSFNNQYSKDHPVTKALKFFSETDILYGYYDDLLSPYSTDNFDFNKVPVSYIDTLYSLKSAFNCDDCVISLNYLDACYFYNRFLCRDSLGKDNETYALYDTARNFFKGKTKDRVLFKLIKDNMNRGLPNFEVYLKRFTTDCYDSSYKKYIDSLYKRSMAITTADTILNTRFISVTGDTINWHEILTQNKGKVIYTDFWASWCVPCIALIPFSIRLDSTFKNKNISFIYISIDADKEKWLKAISKTGLNGIGTHYLMIESHNSALSRALGIPPIPHYLLMGKQSQVIAAKASRPNNPGLVFQLNKLSENK